MRPSLRAPRWWLDLEYGNVSRTPQGSVESFNKFGDQLGRSHEAWVFGCAEAAWLRGFRYPLHVHTQYAVPATSGPGLVLVDEAGDQMWFAGASTKPGEASAAAGRILRALDLLPTTPGGAADSNALEPYDEVHVVRGESTRNRLRGKAVLRVPAGRTMLVDRRWVSVMQFDRDQASAGDLSEVWNLATQPRAWLGPPTELILYDSDRTSYDHHHQGCQFIATGQSGRQLWCMLPEPDEYDRVTPNRRRHHYEGSFIEFQMVVRRIFDSVGLSIDQPDARSVRDKLLGRHHPPPPVIRWP